MSVPFASGSARGPEALAAITRIACGNCRRLERIRPQIERVLNTNELDIATD